MECFRFASMIEPWSHSPELTIVFITTLMCNRAWNLARTSLATILSNSSSYYRVMQVSSPPSGFSCNTLFPSDGHSFDRLVLINVERLEKSWSSPKAILLCFTSCFLLWHSKDRLYSFNRALATFN